MAMAATLHNVTSGAPDALGLILASGGPKLSRGQLHRSIVETACALQRAGLKPGDVVSTAYANTLDFVVSFLAITYARGVAAPLNAAYKVDEFSFYLEDTSSKMLLVPSEGNKAAQEAAQKHSVPVAKFTVKFNRGTPVPTFTPQTPGLAFPSAPAGIMPQLKELPRPSDLALFFHTSGTTGRPKAVPLNHANLMASITNICATYELCPSDRSYLVMPLFHVHGLLAGFLSPLAAGGAVILPEAGKFSANVFWQDCCENGATYFTAVPTMHQILLARAATDYPAANPPPLRFIRSCSSSLAPATLEKVEAAFKVPVLEAYAMSEAAHQMTSNPLPKNGAHKPGSVGKAQGSVQVTVLDANNKHIPVGTVGEVCIKGPNVTAGYLNNPKANVEAFAGGWFHTGDEGWMDAEGYLTLTGRIKELINRGGEKISPLEVDSILLSHPAVAEAVCFGAPDEKYGEVVAAALVLKPDADSALKSGGAAAEQTLKDGIRKHCAVRLSGFKVPGQIFFTAALPKTATGKIQRRHMVTAFIKPEAAGSTASSTGATHGSNSSSSSIGSGHVAGMRDGYSLTAKAMSALGIKNMFGVVGIPVTPLASAVQAEGIRFIGFRNEQAAGYAAAAAGYLTGTPAVLLTVSGPGAINGLAGLTNASVNCWPLIQISGSCEMSEVGKGSFQECDQVAALGKFCKYAGQALRVEDIPSVLSAAFHAASSGRPGAAYVDIPSNVLMALCDDATLCKNVTPASGLTYRPSPSALDVSAAAALLRSASRPLLVVGKGAAMARAEVDVQALVNQFGIPVLGTAMGRGCVPDDHALCVNAARSKALAQADVAVIVGARLNWQLHFGESPKWAPGVKFILIDIEPSERDRGLAQVTLVGDAGAALSMLRAELSASAAASLPPQFSRDSSWVSSLTSKAHTSTASLAQRLSQPPKHPLDYYSALGMVREALEREAAAGHAPVVASEGANTMDMARLLLPVHRPRSRLDAGTWGTMGVGLGYAIASAVVDPSVVTVAVEGDSAFGFSGMEIETMVRYKLPIVVVVMNNGGIYGGDRREVGLAAAALSGAKAGGFQADPIPTELATGSRYDKMMAAFGGASYHATTAAELQQALAKAFTARQPALIDVELDPMAGVESGNVHSFNAPSMSKL